MSGTIQHWLGGIPPSILVHPEGRMSDQAMREESKAWLLFVSVCHLGHFSASLLIKNRNNGSLAKQPVYLTLTLTTNCANAVL